jgi:iduronate 2-sulfatase
VPLFIRAPGKYASGVECGRLVELVDLYPTLCDLAGIDIPDDMEGVSLAPMLKNPETPLKSAVFSQYHQKPRSTLDGNRYMGYSMVTERYHYVEWFTWDDDQKLTGELVGVELYDNESDPKENVSIAGYPENKGLVQALSRQLKAGWQAAKLRP